jgi:UDP-GlcNAc:undecaprenyl-phosphate/decaprenyl-phosphate GlcNAc-1-phosphate transferase
MTEYLIFFVPILLSLALTPVVITYAKRIGAIDQPNERKVHTHPIPRLGGVVIYISFFVSLILAIAIDPSLSSLAGLSPKNGIMLVGSLTLVLLLGIWDDLKPLPPGKKFLGQVVAASIVYFSGFEISSITHPLTTSDMHLGFFSYFLTVLWIVGVTNAFNLIDGLDGLASGVALIVSITIFSISLIKNDTATAVMALLMAGSLIGFLRYNFQGARIFLGDSGSLFIGFTLAILSMQSSTKGGTAFSIIVPVLALGLPIMDTVLSMIRRFVKSVLPHENRESGLMGKLTTMFHPDKGHIHHQLISKGFSHRKVVLLLYVVSCFFGLAAFAITLSNNFGATLIIISIAIASFIGIRQLRYREMAILRNGLLLPMYEWPLLQSSLFLSFVDLGFLIVAYLAAFNLAFHEAAPIAPGKIFITSVAMVTGIQLAMFYATGLYRSTVRQLFIGDILKMVKVVLLTVAVTFSVLAFIPGQDVLIDPVFIMLDFFILLSLVLLSRGSFRILGYLSQRELNPDCTKVLIYGADAHGLLLLQRFRHDPVLRYCPVGFLDEDPRLEGKKLDGFPIFGGHRKLARLIQTKQLREVILSSDSIGPVVYRRLLDICRDHGVILRRSTVRLEECRPHTQEEQIPVPIPVSQESFHFANQ